MRNVFLFLLLLGFHLGVSAQNTFQYLYKESIWTIQVYSNKAIELSNGEIYINPINSLTPINDNRKTNLLKVDAGGNQLWTKSYGVSGKHIENNSFEQVSDNMFILSGSTFDRVTQKRFHFLMNVDGMGSTNWAKSYESPRSHGRACLAVLKDKSTLICGKSETNPNDSYLTLINTDTSGNINYSKKIITGTDDQIEPIQVIPTNDGGMLITGVLYSEIDIQDLPLILIKLDEDANIEWSKTYLGGTSSYGRGMQTSDGGYIIAGSSNITGRTVAYLMKIDLTGNVQWCKIYWTKYIDMGNQVIEDGDGNFIMMGTSTYSEPMAENVFFMVKTDQVGEILWERYYGASIGSQNFIRSFQQTLDGGFLASGEKLNTIDPYFTNFDAYLIKTDSLGYVNCDIHDLPMFDSSYNFTVGEIPLLIDEEVFTVVDLPIYEMYNQFTQSDGCTMGIDELWTDIFKVYPNPSSGIFNIESAAEFDKILVLDMFGRNILTNVGANIKTVDMSIYPSGIYFMRIYDGSKMLASEKIIVQ